MGHTGTLVPGNLVAVAALGTAGVIVLPYLPTPLAGTLHVGSLLAVRILLLADAVWALLACGAGLLLLRRRGVDRGLRAAHVVAYAFIIPAGVVCVHVFGGSILDATLAETLGAVMVGALAHLVRSGSSNMPQGGRGWTDRGQRLGGGLRY